MYYFWLGKLKSRTPELSKLVFAFDPASHYSLHTFLPMKNPLIALALSFALTATAASAAPALHPTQNAAAQEPAMTKQQKKAAKLKRREHQSDVYKGSISKQTRLVEDAPDAEKDKQPADTESKEKKVK